MKITPNIFSLLTYLVLSMTVNAAPADSIELIQNKSIADSSKINLLINYMQQITGREQNTSEGLRALNVAEKIAYSSNNLAKVSKICRERSALSNGAALNLNLFSRR